MIKFETNDVWGFEWAFKGMRNPMNSWNKSDSNWLFQEIGKNGFGRYDGSGVINVSIGTQDTPSELQLSLSNAPAFNFGSDPVNVQFYTRNTKYTLDSDYIMTNFVNNMIVETPLLS